MAVHGKGGKPKKAHPKLSVQDVLSMERDADFVHAGEGGQQQQVGDWAGLWRKGGGVCLCAVFAAACLPVLPD